MGDLHFTLAAGTYDRTQPLRDGSVKPDGCTLTYLEMKPMELFFRVVRYAEFEITEMSFSTHIMQTQLGNSRYVGLPVFLSRSFRHSSFYINKNKGIEKPEDLKGKTVGVPEYQMTAALWQRGLLKDEYGIEPWEIKWRTGGLEEAGREERMALNLDPKFDVEPIPSDKTLSSMLAAGELDAVICPPVPSCFTNGHPGVDRLWPDFRPAEEEFYKKTGMFPIMHMVGIRNDVVEKYPWLPATMYKAFRQAKDVAIKNLEFGAAACATLPWLNAELRRTRAVMGHDYWQYGLEENRKDIEAMLRYSVEQGLTEPGVKPEDLFAESTWTTTKE